MKEHLLTIALIIFGYFGAVFYFFKAKERLNDKSKRGEVVLFGIVTLFGLFLGTGMLVRLVMDLMKA